MQNPEGSKISEKEKDEKDSNLVLITEEQNQKSVTVISEKQNPKPVLPIYITTHLQTAKQGLFCCGNKDKFISIPSNTTLTSLGFSIEILNKELSKITAGFTGAAIATKFADDELSIQLEQLKKLVNNKLLLLNGYRKELEEQKKNISVDLFTNNSLLKFYMNEWKLNEYNIYQLCINLFSYGNIPQTMNFIKINTKHSTALSEFWRIQKTNFETETSQNMFGNSAQNNEQITIICQIVSYLRRQTNLFNKNDPSLIAIKGELMEAFIDLHEYLYKQECMKNFTQVFNLVCGKLDQNPKNNEALTTLRASMKKFLTENSEKLPTFVLFTGYHEFRQKLQYLIQQIEKPNLQRELQDHIDNKEKDTTTSTFKKYELLNDTLYDSLKEMYTAVKNLDPQAHPKKWNEFKGVLLIIIYLNSYENAFSRENLFAAAPRTDKLLLETRKIFAPWQNDTGNIPVKLSENELQQFYYMQSFLTEKTLANLKTANELEEAFPSLSTAGLVFEHLGFSLPNNYGKTNTKVNAQLPPSSSKSEKGTDRESSQAIVPKTSSEPPPCTIM